LAHKYKAFRHGPATATSERLGPRVDRAVSEGRFQQALELAKQLHKYEPSPAHLELLKKTYLGRARQLHGSGYDRDATTVLEAAVRIDAANAAWLEQVAAELAACGGGGKALELIKQVPGASVSSLVVARAVDATVQREAAGRDQLPPELHADFDRIFQAFKQVETGQDEAAKATLQGIGLKSPFLDWKLFLRGLQAFYQNDDTRATENWSRLNPERAPARLAAPFRCRIDRAFREAQPAETQAALRAQLDRLQGSHVAEQLRRLRAALASSESRSLAGVFRQIEALLPALRAEAPDLIPRLAACCYWAVQETGPDDTLRYKRVFGAPHDDPNFRRIEALASERAGELEQAHRTWQEYEKEIAAAAPSVWPRELAPRARALIWLRMGKNAAQVPSRKMLAKIPPHLRDAADWPRQLKPGAEQCFDRCIALAPDLLEPYEALFQYHVGEDQTTQAETAARRLLERFPDHIPTLTALAASLHHAQHYPEALELYQRALKANPLDRKLRASVSVAHVGCARLELDANRFDVARTHLQSALTFNDDPDDSQIRCRWAAVEFKAGNADAAEQQLREARQHVGAELPVSFRMLTECARLKLDRKLKARFDKEVKAGFTAEPTAAAVVGLLHVATPLKQGGITYYGQKSHEKKIATWAEKVRSADLTARQFVDVIMGLMGLAAWKPAERVAVAAARRHKKDPEFAVLQARVLLQPNGRRPPPFYQVRPLLNRAEKLLHDLPREDERRERLTKEVAELRQLADALDPLGRFPFPDFFDRFDDEDDEDDDDYFDGF
jgi:tetratricopeptide (TPR) repeat protein